MINAMKNKVILLLIANLISLYSVCQMKEASQWDKYVQPILNNISHESGKKIFLDQKYLRMSRSLNPCMDSLLFHEYGIDKNEWYCIYDSWSNNNEIAEEWKKSISQRKKDKLFKRWFKERFLKNSILIYNIPQIIFIRPNVYLMERFVICPGNCGSLDISIIEYDEIQKKPIVKQGCQIWYS